MRINGVYLPTPLWLIVFPFYLLFLGFKGVVCIFLALMKALDKHNRRRAVRKAYQQHQAALGASYTAWQLPPTQQPPWATQDRIPIQWQDENGNWRVS